jgi:predicted dehydrogenase
MHYEVDFSSWDTPPKLHETSALYIQRGKDGYGKREQIPIPGGDMFRDELEIFAQACQSGRLGELTARDGNVALAVVDAALKSIERRGAAVRLDEVLGEARARIKD